MTTLYSLFAIALVAVAPICCASAQAAPDAPTRLAVLYFENQGNPQLEMLKLGLAQMLITDLAPEEDLEVVERTRINDILGELKLQKTATIDPESAVRIGKVLGVEYLIQGYYLYFPPVDSLIVGAQLVSVETGAVVSGFRTQGKQAEFLDLEAQLVAGLLPRIRKATGRAGAPSTPDKGASNEEHEPTKNSVTRGGGGTEKPAASAETRPSLEPDDSPADAVEETMAEAPPEGTPVDSLGAALAFSEGLDALDRRDIPRAREALRRAMELDPTLDDARAALEGMRL